MRVLWRGLGSARMRPRLTRRPCGIRLGDGSMAWRGKRRGAL